MESNLPDEEAQKAGTGEEAPVWAWPGNTWADYTVFLQVFTGASDHLRTLTCCGPGPSPPRWPWPCTLLREMSYFPPPGNQLNKMEERSNRGLQVPSHTDLQRGEGIKREEAVVTMVSELRKGDGHWE